MTEYDVKASFIITEKDGGRTIEREVMTTYHSGNQPADEQRIVRKTLRRVLADLSLLKIPKNEKEP